MKHRTIGALIGACLGVSIYLLATQKPAPALVVHQEPVVTSSAPASPTVVPEVVEVTDIDPLLDPPARPVTGAPFDSDPVMPVSVPAAPERIPPAID